MAKRRLGKENIVPFEVPDEQKPRGNNPGMIPSIEDFAIVKPISRGAFGKVFLGHKKNDRSQLYAIKVMKKADMVNKNMVDQVVAERNTLAVVKSPFVVRLFYSLQTELYIYLVMEYMIGGDLKSLLSVCGYLDEDMAIVYTAEVTLALEYLHNHGIVHRDVKPDNMLISNEGHIKLTDFGLSRINLKRQINVGDVLSTPMGMGGNRLKKEYFRTPGQVLSLTSHFAFNSSEKKRRHHNSASSCGSLSRSRTISMSPAPIKGLTPTLESSKGHISPRSENERKVSQVVKDEKTVPELCWDDELEDTKASDVRNVLVSPPSDQMMQKSDIEETPQLASVRNKARLRSFASEKMRSVRTGSSIGSMGSDGEESFENERRSLDCVLDDCNSSVDEGDSTQQHEGTLRGVSNRSDSLVRKNSIEFEERLSGPRLSFSSLPGTSPTRCPPLLNTSLQTPIGPGGRKRGFYTVGKSPLKSSSWHSLPQVNQNTGLTTEIHGLKLGDEHRLKRPNSVPMELDGNGAHQERTSSVGSDSVFAGDSPIPDSEIEIFRTADVFDIHDSTQPMFSMSSIGSASASQSFLRGSEAASFHTPENFIIPSYSNSKVSYGSLIQEVSSVSEVNFNDSDKLWEGSSKSSQEEAFSNIGKEQSEEKVQKKKAAFKVHSLVKSFGSCGSGLHPANSTLVKEDRIKPLHQISKTPGPMMRTPFRTPKSVRRGRRPTGEEVDNRILGTPDYLAPELLMQRKHGAEVDWWALGVCMFEFLTGVPPFNDDTQELVFQNILNRDIPWPEEEEALSSNSLDVINGLLTFDPTKRYKASDLLEHALFGDIEWENLHKREMPFIPAPENDCDTTYFDPRNEMQNLKVSALIT